MHTYHIKAANTKPEINMIHQIECHLLYPWLVCGILLVSLSWDTVDGTLLKSIQYEVNGLT